MTTTGFELILPFLRPIQHLILDPDISEIMVNGPEHVFIERAGRVEAVPGLTLSPKSLEVAVRNVAHRLGDDISEEKPVLDSRLPDGSRVAAVVPLCSLNGVVLTIRKFNARNFGIEDLIRIGTITEELAEMLRTAVINRRNILISGGTGTGKTTLLNILANFIPVHERILVIEDTAEIQIGASNIVRFEARVARWIALATFIFSSSLQTWAMVANSYFSPVVRIQAERGHKLIHFGPYRFVRHPGYLAMCISVSASAVAIGSWLALIPAGAFIAVVYERGKFEEQFLKANLPGYAQYAKTVPSGMFHSRST
jgi:protein-S-isoprenylcysteine O-methyltransferase Ste14